jgi:hypothetical protein
MRGFLLLSLLVVLGCNGDDAMDGGAGASGDGDGDMECNVTPPTRCENDTRWADVEPIFQERCGSCHQGLAGGPWGLTTYAEASTWPDHINDAMRNCSMPPPDAGIEMPVEEREKLLEWIRCGTRN